MSTLKNIEFFGFNQMPSKASFQQRALYKEYGLLALDKKINLTDFLYKSPFYGKLNKSGVPVQPNTSFLKPLFDNDEVYVLDFVAEAYYGFITSYALDLEEKFGIRNFNSRLANIRSVKAWEDVEELYYDHQNQLFENFHFMMTESRSFRKKCCNYFKFLPTYWWFLNKALESTIPVTKAGFIKSKFCTPNISGLIIEIFDEEKFGSEAYIYNNFIQDPLFDAYVKKAASFGFSIDRNAPWRLVARLDSPQMQYYMSLYNTSWNTVFSDYYNDVIFLDFEQFKANSVQFYNTLASNFPVETYPKATKNRQYSQNSVILHSQSRVQAPLDAYNDLVDFYWFEKYYDHRMKESGIELDKKELKRQTKKINRAALRDGYSQAFYTMQFKCGMCMLDPEALPILRPTFFYNGALDKETLIYSLDKKKLYFDYRKKIKKSWTKKQIVKINKKAKTSYAHQGTSTIDIPVSPAVPVSGPKAVKFIPY